MLEYATVHDHLGRCSPEPYQTGTSTNARRPRAMVQVGNCGRGPDAIEKRRPAVSEPTSQYAQTKGRCINSSALPKISLRLRPKVISNRIATAATEIPSGVCQVLRRSTSSQVSGATTAKIPNALSKSKPIACAR